MGTDMKNNRIPSYVSQYILSWHDEFEILSEIPIVNYVAFLGIFPVIQLSGF